MTIARTEVFARRASSLLPLLRAAGARGGRPVVAISASSEALAAAACAAFFLDSPFFPLDPGLPEGILADLLDQVGDSVVIGEGQNLSTEKILAAEPGDALAFRPPPGPALLIATSGSSGRPKAVVLTGAALKTSARASLKATPLHPGQSWLACLPLFHIGGFSILVRCAFSGARAVLHQGFDRESVHGALAENRVTHVSLTPTMLSQLLALKNAPKTLGHALVGGAALSADLAQRAAEAGWPVQPTYGMSETAAQIATLPRLPSDWRSGNVGRPFEGVEAGLDADGRLKIRGPMLMQGYANPELSPGGGLLDGWFVTNDLAEISAEGELTILGRADDAILSGGKKIFPATVENLLARCSGVEFVAVTGRPDPVWGEIVTAIFCGPMSPDEFLGWCRENLSGAFRPRAAVRLQNPPLLANGKPDRLKLRELALGGDPQARRLRQV